MRSSSADCGGGASRGLALALGLLLTAFLEGFLGAGFLPVFFRATGFLTLALGLDFLLFAGLRVYSSVL